MEEKELLEIFSSFPSKEHVEKNCKLGSGKGETCRFLMVDSKHGFRCSKTTNLRKVINGKVKRGEMTADGDNCNGLLGLLMEQKEKLKNKTVTHRESSPTFFAKGLLRDIQVRGENLYIKGDWKNIGIKEQFYNIEHLEISVDDSIVFTVAGLGDWGGKTKISLK